MHTYTSDPFDLPALDAGERLSRADLVVYGVEHRGPSYEVRAFFDNAEADHLTPLELHAGYAGCFTVFGHGGCFGEAGHCDPAARTTDAFDLRPPNKATPQTKLIVCTAAVARLTAATTVVRLVCVRPGEGDGPEPSDALEFESMRLLGYE